jgi:hypothetical protein
MARKSGQGSEMGCFSFWTISLAIVLALTGCGNNGKKPQPVVLNGVTIDLPKLQRSCISDNSAIRDSIDRVRLSIRYADYRTALAELGKLANNPDITDGQKKTINHVSDQVKRAFAKTTPNSANPVQ